MNRFSRWFLKQRFGKGRIERLADPEQTKNRAEIVTRACQMLLALNGGAAIALLAFLGKVWPETARQPFNTEIIVAITNAIFLLVIGLGLAFVALAIRYNTSLEGQFVGNGLLFRAYQKIHTWSLWGSIAIFLIAMVSLAWNVPDALPAELGKS